MLPPSVKITPPPQSSGASGVIFASSVTTAFQNTKESVTAIAEGTLTQSYTKLTYTGSQWQSFTGTTTITSSIETTIVKRARKLWLLWWDQQVFIGAALGLVLAAAAVAASGHSRVHLVEAAMVKAEAQV